MALFGRRKPGFSKEVKLKPEDISGEFSDRNDPAMVRNANPKMEKAEMAARAQAVMDGTAKPAAEAAAASASEDLAQAAAARGETVDLFEYLDSLPEVADPFPPSEPDPEPAPEPERKPAEMLAEYIRERTKAVSLTGRKSLAKEEPHLDEMLEELRGLESCKDICTVKGNKDEYFYSDEHMAHNYARIAMLVLEKDIPLTIAEMVRFNCKTYPSPTAAEACVDHAVPQSGLQRCQDLCHRKQPCDLSVFRETHVLQVCPRLGRRRGIRRGGRLNLPGRSSLEWIEAACAAGQS